MDYWKYTIQADAERAEILIALLSDGPFDAFEETEYGFHAFVPADAGQQDALLDDLSENWFFTWEKTFIPYQNWNEVWESNFQPVQVGRFCGVRASFHPPFTDVEHELVIQPKMAFGTGHHETTWMCLAALEDLPLKGARVLDFGCGTGILAILAIRLGAVHAEAVDIEEESYRNTLENAEVNGVGAQIAAHCGTLRDVPPGPYDVILANINRNVILENLSDMKDMLHPEGVMLASGFLAEDEAVLRESLARLGMHWVSHRQRGRWLAAVWKTGLEA